MKYQEDLALKVQTYSGPGLVALQYQAISEHLEELKLCIEKKDEDSSNSHMNKIREILANLMVYLGCEDEFDLKTRSLYLYINEKMTDAFLKKNPEMLEDLIEKSNALKSAWEEAGINLGAGSEKQAAVGATYSKAGADVYLEGKEWKA